MKVSRLKRIPATKGVKVILSAFALVSCIILAAQASQETTFVDCANLDSNALKDRLKKEVLAARQVDDHTDAFQVFGATMESLERETNTTWEEKYFVLLKLDFCW